MALTPQEKSSRIAEHFSEDFLESLPRLMDFRQIEELSGVPVGTLKYFRHRGHGGPPMFAVSARNIRATREDVLVWLAERIEAEQGAAA